MHTHVIMYKIQTDCSVFKLNIHEHDTVKHHHHRLVQPNILKIVKQHSLAGNCELCAHMRNECIYSSIMEYIVCYKMHGNEDQNKAIYHFALFDSFSFYIFKSLFLRKNIYPYAVCVCVVIFVVSFFYYILSACFNHVVHLILSRMSKVICMEIRHLHILNRTK